VQHLSAMCAAVPLCCRP